MRNFTSLVWGGNWDTGQYMGSFRWAGSYCSMNCLDINGFVKSSSETHSPQEDICTFPQYLEIKSPPCTNDDLNVFTILHCVSVFREDSLALACGQAVVRMNVVTMFCGLHHECSCGLCSHFRVWHRCQEGDVVTQELLGHQLSSTSPLAIITEIKTVQKPAVYHTITYLV